jgi:O-antigen ligase
MEALIYQEKRKSGVLVYSNATLVAMIVTIFIIRPAKEALIAILGNVIGGVIYYFLKLGNYCTLLCLIGWLLYHSIIKRQKVTIPTYCMLCYVVVLLYSTVRMGAYSLLYLFELLGSSLAFFVLFDMMAERRMMDCIRGIYYSLTVAMLLNSLTIYFFYPIGVYTLANGNSNYYLFALDNICFLYEIATLGLGVVYHVCYEHKIPLITYVIHMVILGAYFYSGAATAMVVAFCALFFIITYRIFNKLKLIKIISFRLIVIASIFTFLVIVLFRSVSGFSWLFNLVGKDSTFNSRTSIWNAALNIWKEHWIVGIGTNAEIINSYLHMGGLSSAWGSDIGHLHNVLLEVIFDGGILALFFFACILLSSYKKMQDANKYMVTKVLCVFFYLQWLSVTFDFRTNTYTFWLIPIVMFRVPVLVKYYNQLKGERGRRLRA